MENVNVNSSNDMINNDADADAELELEWEEWDGQSPFLHHCIAGGMAGVAEHTLLYPIDTVKTHMQSYCVDCPHNVKHATSSSSATSSAIRTSVAGTTADHGMWRTMRNIMLNGNSPSASHASQMVLGNHSSAARPATSFAATCFPEASTATASSFTAEATATVTSASESLVIKNGFGRLWRGVQTMAVGCAPAHALYFSSYEAIKGLFLYNPSNNHNNNHNHPHHLSPFGSSVAGATATFFHDLIMTPLDTVKQRLQLGHYQGMWNGFSSIIQHEGYGGLYRSFPITLLTNLPYGMIMFSTNEFLKEVLNPDGKFDLQSCLIAGCGAGFTASAITTPLDRVKTRLQTQAMGAVMESASTSPVISTEGFTSTSTSTKAGSKATATSTPCGTRTTKCGKMIIMQQSKIVKYEGWRDAFYSIVREEGFVGLFRGVAPRVMMHSPAVAISWTTYEGAKKWLLS